MIETNKIFEDSKVPHLSTYFSGVLWSSKRMLEDELKAGYLRCLKSSAYLAGFYIKSNSTRCYTTRHTLRANAFLSHAFPTPWFTRWLQRSG
jgi:hypothetical protein